MIESLLLELDLPNLQALRIDGSFYTNAQYNLKDVKCFLKQRFLSLFTSIVQSAINLEC